MSMSFHTRWLSSMKYTMTSGPMPVVNFSTICIFVMPWLKANHVVIFDTCSRVKVMDLLKELCQFWCSVQMFQTRFQNEFDTIESLRSSLLWWYLHGHSASGCHPVLTMPAWFLVPCQNDFLYYQLPSSIHILKVKNIQPTLYVRSLGLGHPSLASRRHQGSILQWTGFPSIITLNPE